MLALEGRNDERERVREALVTLADGQIGANAPLLENCARPWMVATGVYDGDGPETHLLTGPVLTPLPADVDSESPLRLEGILQPAQHLVEACGQPRDLVSAARRRESPPKIARPADLLSRDGD